MMKDLEREKMVQIVERLNTEHRLVDTFFKEVKQFKAVAIDTYNKMEKDVSLS